MENAEQPTISSEETVKKAADVAELEAKMKLHNLVSAHKKLFADLIGESVNSKAIPTIVGTGIYQHAAQIIDSLVEQLTNGNRN